MYSVSSDEGTGWTQGHPTVLDHGKTRRHCFLLIKQKMIVATSIIKKSKCSLVFEDQKTGQIFN